jgi:Tol biopolymer transport system component
MRTTINLKACCRICLVVFFLSYTISARAQYFGRNKVNYRNFDFRVFETPHFDIYNYLKSTERRTRFAQQVEQWYRNHQTIFRDTFHSKNPLLIYDNHADFQQTRAIEGSIGVGTGGVTEALKNRVVMPFMESNAQTDHVLGHELVHAFQYHLITDTLSLNAVNNIPLWMVEGLAEYMSIGPVDAHTAIWLRSAVAADKLPTLKDLTNKPNEYFPYRWGEAFWAYTTGIYGDTIIKRLFIETARNGYEAAIKKLFKMDAKAFSEKWKTAIRTAYTPYQKSTSLVPPGKQVIYKKNAGELNIVPSISPDGRKVAFWTEKNLFSIDLYVADAETGGNQKRITSNTFASHIDEYSSFESSVAWSPDSRQVAFVAFSKGQNKIIIAGTDNGKITREIAVPGVPAVSNPTWSPDGNTIVVTGLVEGQSDLYSYNLSNGSVKQLTNDRYADLMPSFSNDGKWIAFTTDRKSVGSNTVQHSFSHNVALLDVRSGSITPIDIFDGANNMNPVFSPDNRTIYFISNRDGFRNLYSYSLDTKELQQLTNLFTGITGITEFSPAISVSRQTGKLVYTYYSNDRYTIFSAGTSDFLPKPVAVTDINLQAAAMPPFVRTGPDIVKSDIEHINFPLNQETAFKEVPFKPKFQLDYVSNSGGGMSTGPFGTGMSGGINGIFSDILGNNQLFGALAINGEIYDFGGQFAYLNQKKRINWGASVSHLPYLSGAEHFAYDTLKNGDTALTYNLDLLRTFEDQGGLFASYPFSQIRRVEGGASFSRYYYRLEEYSDYYDPNSQAYITSTKKKLPVPRGFNLGQVYLAYVGDNSFSGVASPLAGHRFRFEAGQYLGAVTLSNLTGDFRKYFRFAPLSLATRNMYVGRFGSDAGNGTLPPIYIGYPTLIRGYNAQKYANDENRLANDVSINDLAGTQAYVGNVELRLPFTGPERLSVIKSGFLFSELNLFTDAGVAWGRYEGFGIQSKSTSPRTSKLIMSSGVSLRVNLFGYLILEPYVAVPWQNGGFSNTNFGLNFIPGF